MTGTEPAPALRLVPGALDDEAELAASMARHPAKGRQESLPEPRPRRWLRIGRRA